MCFSAGCLTKNSSPKPPCDLSKWNWPEGPFLQRGEVLFGIQRFCGLLAAVLQGGKHLLQPVLTASPQVCVPAGQRGLLCQLCHRLCLHRERHGPAAHPGFAHVHDTPLPGPLGRRAEERQTSM